MLISGIPEFWLTIFKNVDMLQEMVQEHDEPVLAALTDVKVTFSDGSNESSPMVLLHISDLFWQIYGKPIVL